MSGIVKADGTPFNGEAKHHREPLTMSRVDGWFNALSGHGTVRHSKSENSQFHVDILDDETARDLWRADDIAARVVETLPAEAFRQGFKLNMEDKEAAEDIMAQVEDLGVTDFFVKAKEFERAYGGSAIYPIINDGQEDLSQPLNMDRISSIDNMLVFEARELQPSQWYGELTEPKFGLPSVYQLSANTEGTAAPPSVHIHESRLIIFRGIRVSRTQTSQRTSWGDSVLNRVVRTLRDFNISWASAAELLNDFSQAVFKIKGLAELIAADKDDIIKARIRAVQLSRSAIRATMMDADEEFERKQTPIAGLPDLLDRFSTRVAAAADMPVTLLMGQSPAGLNATGESDIRFFYDRVAADQSKKTHSQLEQMIRLIILSKDGPTKGKEPDRWSVEFNPLWQPSSKEVADERKVVADTDQIYLTNQVVSPEEVRVARFGGDQFSADLHIDLEAEAEEDVDKDLTPEELEAAKAANDAVLGTPAEEPAKTAMNGAQIASLINIVISVGAREISRESAASIITTAFPVDKDQAEAILGPEDFTPEPKDSDVAPAPTPPPGDTDDVENEGDEPAEPAGNPGDGEEEEEQRADGGGDKDDDRPDGGGDKEDRQDKIEKRGEDYVVLSADGSQVLGTHKSRAAAERQLRAIEASKAK